MIFSLTRSQFLMVCSYFLISPFYFLLPPKVPTFPPHLSACLSSLPNPLFPTLSPHTSFSSSLCDLVSTLYIQHTKVPFPLCFLFQLVSILSTYVSTSFPSTSFPLLPLLPLLHPTLSIITLLSFPPLFLSPLFPPSPLMSYSYLPLPLPLLSTLSLSSFPALPTTYVSSLGRYVFGSEISYNKAPPRLPGLGC